MTKRVFVTVSEDRRRMREIGLEESLAGDALKAFEYAISDVEVELEVDVVTGASEIVAVNGRKLRKKEP